MQFQVGDRVKIVNFHDDGVNGSLGRVSEIRPLSEFPYRVIWDSMPWGYYENIVLKEEEVDTAVRVGEQLLFNFMVQ